MTLEELLNLLPDKRNNRSSSNHGLSRQQLIDLFGKKEIEFVCDEKIRELTDKIMNHPIPNNELEDALVEDMLEDMRNEIKRWNHVLNVINNKYSKYADIDIDRIKETYPIGNLMQTQPVYDAPDRAKYLCPFHNEKTPSFVWYKKDNNYHCFGCEAHGSVIDLYMHLNKVDFKTAIKELNGMI